MGKIGLIIKREFWTRVNKKSFILLTLLTPILMVAFMALIIYISVDSIKNSDDKHIQVIDESGFFKDQIKTGRHLIFDYVDQDFDTAKKEFNSEERFGILLIPKIDIQDPKEFKFYVDGNPPIDVVRDIERVFKQEIRKQRLKILGITPEQLKSTETKLHVATFNISDEEEEEKNTAAASAIGTACGFIMYFFIFFYGSQVMRGIVEEKSSKIIEVIISSVKPFQLMIGKVIGIILVGLTQFGIWVILVFALITGAGLYFGSSITENQAQQIEAIQQSPMGLENMSQDMAGNAKISEQVQAWKNTQNFINSVNIPKILLMFLFYFLVGYAFYAALFSIIGAASETDQDSQQFMFPVIMPMILAMSTTTVIMQNPSGSLAFWLSIIPFTSPVSMMVRIPFDPPIWELLLSMILLIASFIFAIWIAGRVYRIGILTRGTKVTWKILWKWIRLA